MSDTQTIPLDQKVPECPQRYDIATDEYCPVTQKDWDECHGKLQELWQTLVRPPDAWDPPDYPPADFSFKLRVYPNPMRTDSVFVHQDQPIIAYEGITDAGGNPCYPATPRDGVGLRCGVEPSFAAEIVKRWNAFADMNQ